MTSDSAPNAASTTSLDVVGVGNALVDVLARQDDAFLAELGLVKGGMALVDELQAEALYARMGPGTEISGGSAANTMVGVSSFGGRAAFVGRVSDDQLGAVFAHDIRTAGVRFEGGADADGSPTGRCLIVVTPDAQRTLTTFLGAAAELEPGDVPVEVVHDAAITYLEGYLFDQPAAKEAFREAGRLAHAAGRRVALTLSDSFCVARHRADFLALVDDVDILFANEDEICTLYDVDDFDAAARRLSGHCEYAGLTRSALGSVVLGPDERLAVPAAPVPGGTVVDTTGAGDLYAAGFLYGLTHGHDLAECGRLGSLAAAEVISHIGARPERALRDLLATS